MKVTAIIAAAGSGTRFSKSGAPKQYLKINNKPVILYSLQVFQNSKLINEIIISANKEYFNSLHELSLKNKITKLTKLVEGGKTRFESVRNAFNQIDNSENGLVIIHDAARPNIDIYFIDRMVMELGKNDGIIPGEKISETVKHVKNGIITGTVDRENLYSVQTPQVFKYKVLKASYLKCGKKNDFTDEAALVEYSGYKVKLTSGKRDNIKITTLDDIKVLKTFWDKLPKLKYFFRSK